MKVVVNGEERVLPAGATVREAVGYLFEDATARRGIAVALNGEVVPRGRWDQVRVDASDRIEVLRAVGGG